MSARLLTEIEAFLAESGIGAFRFGLLAVKNGRLIDRLRDGGRVWPETESEIRAFMIAERRRRAEASADKPLHPAPPLSDDGETAASAPRRHGNSDAPIFPNAGEAGR